MTREAFRPRGVHGFFDFACERYRIYLRKLKGEPSPWTADRVLQQFRFCNVFREDDKTTAWFRQAVRYPLSLSLLFDGDGSKEEHQRNCERLLMSTVVFRWFNRIDVGEILLENKLIGLDSEWSSPRAKQVLKDKKPIVTGAYMIKSPPNMSKLHGLCQCIDHVYRERDLLAFYLSDRDMTLEGAHKLIMEFPYLGSFMAYEIVADLYHTPLLGNADKRIWAAAGPGAARGMGWVVKEDPSTYRYTSKADQLTLNALMQELLEKSTNGNMWPGRWPKWDMRTVEHTLCEYDKYRRAQNGQVLKRRYKREGHTGTQRG